MKYTSLRLYMKNKRVHTDYYLEEQHHKDCDLVIDGQSYFKDSYKTSGCGFVCGAECDKYANYLKNKLSCFIKSAIKCYVIFSGCTNVNTKNTKEAHQKIVTHRSEDKVTYFEPAFVEDVQREVLKELNIKYTICEYDSAETIIGVARKFKCPVLTDKIEYCLYGVSCVPPGSVVLSEGEDKIQCVIYCHDKAKSAFGVYANMPLFLTLLNENGVHFSTLAKIIECEDNSKIVSTAVRWVKKQRKKAIQNVAEKLNSENERVAFLELYKKIELLCKYSRGALAVKSFLKAKDDALLFMNDKKWFTKGVSNERIAVPYIALKKNTIFTGSQLLFDQNQPDAMLAAIDIISYSFSLLTNSHKTEFTFIGRDVHSSRVVNTTKIVKFTDQNRKMTSWPLILTARNKSKLKTMLYNETLLLKDFFGKILPGFVRDDLEEIPTDCWALVISLLYYVSCVNKKFEYGAYCVLLCYVQLGPVAERLQYKDSVLEIFLSKSHMNCLEYDDCQVFTKGLERFFNQSIQLSLSEVNRGVLHSLSEFQHCLQHMNYLFRLSPTFIPPSIYHQTYNGTFVYNLYLHMKRRDELMIFLDNRFKSSSVLRLYKKIVNCFESCLKSYNNTSE